MVFRYSLFLSLLFFSIEAVAQNDTMFPSELWHQGEVVLMTKDTLIGEIKYDFDNDIVLLKHKDDVYSYNVRKFLSFQLLDITTETYRDFFALPFPIRANYKVPVLFEVLFEGPLTLLAREAIVEEQVLNQGYFNQPFYTGKTVRRLVKHFFFVDMEGEVYRHTMKKRDLFQLMRGEHKEVRKYFKKNRLKINDEKDLIRIVAYYNDLLGEKRKQGKK